MFSINTLRQNCPWHIFKSISRQTSSQPTLSEKSSQFLDPFTGSSEWACYSLRGTAAWTLILNPSTGGVFIQTRSQHIPPSYHPVSRQIVSAPVLSSKSQQDIITVSLLAKMCLSFLGPEVISFVMLCCRCFLLCIHAIWILIKAAEVWDRRSETSEQNVSFIGWFRWGQGLLPSMQDTSLVWS